VIIRRVALWKLREPDAVMSQFFNAVVMAAIVGLVYLQLPLTFRGAQDHLAAVSLFTITIAFTAMDQLLLFPKERSIYVRESDAGL